MVEPFSEMAWFVLVACFIAILTISERPAYLIEDSCGLWYLWNVRLSGFGLETQELKKFFRFCVALEAADVLYSVLRPLS